MLAAQTGTFKSIPHLAAYPRKWSTFTRMHVSSLRTMLPIYRQCPGVEIDSHARAGYPWDFPRALLTLRDRAGRPYVHPPHLKAWPPVTCDRRAVGGWRGGSAGFVVGGGDASPSDRAKTKFQTSAVIIHDGEY